MIKEWRSTIGTLNDIKRKLKEYETWLYIVQNAGDFNREERRYLIERAVRNQKDHWINLHMLRDMRCGKENGLHLLKLPKTLLYLEQEDGKINTKVNNTQWSFWFGFSLYFMSINFNITLFTEWNEKI